jgi:hypothetical protein
VLKQFLYLNDDLVNQFISQLEGGLYEEESESSTESRERKLGGGLGAGPVKGEAGRTTGSEKTVSRTVRQTPESRYERLIELIEEEGPIRFIEAANDEMWNDLKRGDIVEVESRLSMPTIARILRAAGGFGELLPLIQMFGGDDPQDQEAIQALAALEGFGKATTSKVSVIAAVSGSPDYRFVAQLETAALRAEPDELDGEATVVGTVRRKLHSKERHSTFEFFAGQSNLPSEMRKELESAFDDEAELGADLFVTAPAAIMTPIAIFR